MFASKRSQALADFQQARRRARVQEIMGRLTGASLDLLAFEEVRQQLRARQTFERGVRQIPLDAIVGSVGRYRDFNRSFLPRHDAAASRWADVLMAQHTIGLPPISVYQIGEVYFVRDGNHRVSIARHLGNETIEADVTELQSDVPLSPDDSLDDLILKAEYAEFLEQTQLSSLRPDSDLSLTLPGKYPLLLEHIEVHRYYMGLEEGREIDYAEAVGHWHDTIYRPIVEEIQAQGIMRDFPDRTEADLYVWLAEHRAEIEEELGWQVSAASAIADLAGEFDSYQPLALSPLRRALRAAGRPGMPPPDHWWREQLRPDRGARLLGTVLLPISPVDQDWRALDHALDLSRRDAAQIVGLLAAPDEAYKGGIVSGALQAEFLRRASGVTAHFKTEVGRLERLIVRLGRWADLIALPLPDVPSAPGWDLVRSARGLVLLVPEAAPSSGGILLPFEPTPRADEALFIAAYLSQLAEAPLTVLVSPRHRTTLDQLQQSLPLPPGQTHDVILDAVTIMEHARDGDYRLLVVPADPFAPRARKRAAINWDRLLPDSPISLLLSR